MAADADGDFQAFIDTTGADIYADSVTVENIYKAEADAKITQAILGVSAANVKTNTAAASVGVSAEAAIKGTGTINSGKVTVSAVGEATANAEVITPTVSIPISMWRLWF